MADVTVSFENKFAQIADVHLSERVPALQPYKVGFQVLDKTDDDSRAVGISAFVMDNIWLYIPVFFLDGKLKGSQLMYVKQQDVIVPALDNWVMKLKNKGLAALGKPMDPREQGNRIDGLLRARPEDVQTYQPYATSWNTSKQAAQLDADANSLIDGDTWLRMTAKLAEAEMQFPVPSLLDVPEMGKQASQTFVHTFLTRPDFANLLFQYYDVDTVEKLAHDCIKAGTVSPDDVKAEVAFITRNDKTAADLTDDEKSLLVHQDIYIKDTRTNLSKVFQEEVRTGVLSNPTEAGIFDVLMGDGEYKAFIVLFPEDLSRCPPAVLGHRPSAPTQMVNNVVLIDPDAPNRFIRKSQSDIWCKITRDPKSIFRSKEPGKAASISVLNGLEDGCATVLFTQGPKLCYTGDIRKARGSSGTMFYVHAAGNSFGYPQRSSETECPVVFTDAEGVLGFRHGTLCVPKECRMFVEESYWNRPESQDDKESKYPYVFGNPSDLWMTMQKKAGLTHLEITAPGTGSGVEIRVGDVSTGLLQKQAALEHLVLRHGIYGGQAMTMYKEAMRRGRSGYFLKHAAPYDIAAYGTGKAPFQGGPSGRQTNAVYETIQTTQGKKQDNSQALPESVIAKATDASNAGIKEVFDAEVLKGLLDKADISEIRSDYVSKMMVGMDSAGRMLFLLYWHMDAFEDRYGKDRLDELESNLREVFIQIGDLILFLQEKNDNDPDVSENLFGLMSEDIAVAT